jgi:hypothetical protein
MTPMPFLTTLTDLDFSKNYFRLKKPALIKGGMKSTSECKNWTPEYLSDKIGPKTVQVNFSKKGIFSHHAGVVEAKATPFTEAVRLFTGAQKPDESYYLQQTSIDHNFPELLSELDYPQWILDTDIRMSTNLWFGGANCVSPLHFDISQNFLLQVYGEKHVVLISPDDSPYLYPDTKKEYKNLSNVDPENPDHVKYPLFKKATLMSCILEPGDVLYMPPGWWHQVRSLNPSISVNFWWNRLDIIEGIGFEKADVDTVKKAIQFFTEKGVDIDFRDAEGETMLVKATVKGYTNIVSALLQLGADSAITSTLYQPGASALTIAEVKGYPEISNLLKKYQTARSTNQS